VPGSSQPFVYNPAVADSAALIPTVAGSNAISITAPVLYPNPATNSFQVIIPSTDFTKTYVKIYDISGHLVQTIVPTTQTTLIDASHWAKGTYIVSIFDGQKLTTQKLSKL
jgi:hypothetical protein